MNKIKMICFSMILLGLLTNMALAAEGENYYFEDFEKAQVGTDIHSMAGWGPGLAGGELAANQVSAAKTPSAGKVLHIRATKETKLDACVTINLTDPKVLGKAHTKGKLLISFDYWPETLDGYLEFHPSINPSKYFPAWLPPVEVHSLGGLNAGQWNRVVLNLDFTNNRLSVSINGQKKLQRSLKAGTSLASLGLAPTAGLQNAFLDNISIRSPGRKQLLLDSRIIESVDNAALRVGTVEKHAANPLFGEEHVWEPQFNNLYPNVMYDEQEKLYKIWYFTYTYCPAYANTPPEQRLPGTYMQQLKKYRAKLGTNEPRTDGLGYAVSKDGINWTKPMMDVVPWKGKPSNLVMAPGHGIGVIKEPLERDPTRRYKMVCQMSWHAMGVAFSSDGIHWGPRIPTPEMSSAGDTHNNVLWVPELNKYVCITRLWAPRPDDQRLVGRSESSDFINWTKAEEVMRGTKQKQTYAMPIFRYENVYLGFPAIVHLKTDCTQTELAWSPDTITWHRIDPGTPLIPNGKKKGDYDWGIVHASRPVITDDEIRIYYGGCDGRHGYDWRKGYLCLAKMGPDRFAGYQQEDSAKPSVVLTKPLTLGLGLNLTADAKSGSITVSVLDEQGNTLLRSLPITANVTDQTVSWHDSGSLKKLLGKKARLRFEFTRAKIYSFSL